MKKSFVLSILIIALIFVFSGCSNLKTKDYNKIAKDATKNFDYIVSNNTENSVYHDELEHFGLMLKDGDKFEWTKDTSVSEADLSLSLNAEEFIKAGLDVSKLSGKTFAYQKATETTTDMLVYTYNVSNEKEIAKDYNNAFEILLRQLPEQLAPLENDGYILDIGQVFQVHWNGEERENKDIAFVINAEDLISAGLSVDKLDSWKIMKNSDSNDTNVRLLKVYYLK